MPTNCEIVVMSREQAEAYVPETDTELCISIISHNPDYPYPSDSARDVVLSDKFKAVCRLEIDDIDPVLFPSHQEAVNEGYMFPMTKEEAGAVKAFTEEHFHTATKLIVHCYMGISRSRSMAEAIRKRFFVHQEPFVVRNQFVYDMMMEAYTVPPIGA